MASVVRDVGSHMAYYGFGLLMLFVYTGMALVSGSFFRRESEKDRLELAIARDRIWNISKSWEGLVHKFYVLRNGLQLHYVTNNPDQGAQYKSKPLVVLIHGWPDSFSEWLFVLRSAVLREDCTVVAVDLPGFGGSDSFPPYTPEVVLDAVAEFILGMRELYDVENDADSGHGASSNNGHQSKVYICGHDWGCAIGFRLAAEAPALADRFILTNGPHPGLARANVQRVLSFSTKMFYAFCKAPMVSRHCLSKAVHSIKPLADQIGRFGYVFSFQLPPFMVRFLLYGGNRSFLRGTHRLAAGRNNSKLDRATFLAGVLGPSPIETNTRTIEHDSQKSYGYSPSVALRAVQNNDPFETTAYYSNGIITQPWEKSLGTVAALHDLEISQGQLMSRRHSSGALLFKEHYEGALKTPVTIVWGQKDPVMKQEILLDGIGDYLAKGSQVVVLPRSGHWTTTEVEGSRALQRVIEWAVQGEKIEVLDGVVKEVYQGASVTVRK